MSLMDEFKKIIHPYDDEDEYEEEFPEPKGARFNDQKPWKRIIVLLAGAAMNYLLALFFIFIMFNIPIN